ncbi:MAG: ATP-dependent DNA helicase [Bdellovibrionales bacterium]
MKKKSKNLQLSVTDFAVPSPRLGHIESDSAFGQLPMVGTEIHQELQRRRSEASGIYVPERWMTHTFQSAKMPFKVTVSGRLDGIYLGAHPRIEEIKSTYSLQSLRERLSLEHDHPYRLQLRTYGYLHWRDTGLEPDLKLILVCSRTRELVEMDVDLDRPSLEAWIDRRLAEIVQLEQRYVKRHGHRNQQVQRMVFPFSNPRPGQIELMDTVANSAARSQKSLFQAPTGLGKTMGILFPTLKEAFGRGQKTIYVTAKNSQHGVAEDAVKRLQEQGTKIRSVTIHAKAKMCLKEDVICNPEYCEYARDYYTKLHEHGIVEKLAKKRQLTEKTFRKMGEDTQTCPFELQLEAAMQADVLIADYNYVFAPRHALGRLLANGLSSSTAPNLIIDEAHNLADRAKDYYSFRLDLTELEGVLAEATYLPEDLWSQARRLVDQIRQMAEALREKHGNALPFRFQGSELDSHLMKDQAQILLGEYLQSGLPLRTGDPVLEICYLVRDFAEALEQIGDEFVFTYSEDRHQPVLRCLCCDAAPHLKARYEHFHAVMAFSATLKPFDYYLRTLGLDPDSTEIHEFSSPFSRDQRKILIIPQVSTKFRDRDRSARPIRELIERIVQVRPGNYFVFFPSFAYLEQIAAQVSVPDFRILRQKREMRRNEIQEWIDSLKDNSQPTLLFAVQGGVFAEGVDYPGDMIIGALIVGPALPTFDFDRECLRQYFATHPAILAQTDQNSGQLAFDYAYTFPAMTRVIQSAGRVIRSETDRGLIVLIDRRFLDKNYLRSMPSEWLSEGSEALLSQQILQDIRDFWYPSSDATVEVRECRPD